MRCLCCCLVRVGRRVCSRGERSLHRLVRPTQLHHHAALEDLDLLLSEEIEDLMYMDSYTRFRRSQLFQGWEQERKVSFV